jgi:hypothetical protein
MLARNPAERPQTPAEVAAAIAVFTRSAAGAIVSTATPNPAVAASGSLPNPPEADSQAALQDFLKNLASAPEAETIDSSLPMTIAVKPASLAPRRTTVTEYGRWWPLAATAVAAAILLPLLLMFGLRPDDPQATQQHPSTQAVAANVPKDGPRRPAADKDGRIANPAPRARPTLDQPPAEANLVEPQDTTATPESQAAAATAAAELPSGAKVEPTSGDEELAAASERQADEALAATLAAGEALAAMWDFQAAESQLNGLQLDDADLGAGAILRRDQLVRMRDLKERIMAKLANADPPLKSDRLRIAGQGGQVTNANAIGITILRSNGKMDTVRWSDLSSDAVGRILALAIDTKNADDCLAAALLALHARNTKLATRYLEGAQANGLDVADQMGPFAASALAEAEKTLANGDAKAAERLLDNLRQKYSATAWFESHRALVGACRERVQRALFEADAQQLYVQATELFEAGELFDLKPIVHRLRAEFASSDAVRDGHRTPSFAELEQTTANLGHRVIVRQDGKGDFTSIQGAIDAAPPESLIEIHDSGSYNERINIDKDGLTLRGKRDCWPTITSVGKVTSFPVLVTANATNVSIDHVILDHSGAAGNGAAAFIGGTRLSRSLVLKTHFDGGVSCAADSCVMIGGGGFAPLKNSVVFGSGRAERVENVLVTGGIELASIASSCTFAGGGIFVQLPGVSIRDCVTPSIQSPRSDVVVEHCNVYGNPPYVDAVKPGKGCFGGDPQFVDPANLDFRLRPTSPATGKASDGGDVGFRYKPEIVEVLNKAFELRRQGLIKF